jgi:hypothetical protein
MPHPMDNVPLQWAPEQHGSHGDGISRPMPKARTKMFRLRVKQPGAQPMVVTMPAENKSRAIRYAGARWPGAAVEVLA